MSMTAHATDMIARFNKIDPSEVDNDHADLVARVLKRMPRTGEVFNTVMLKMHSPAEAKAIDAELDSRPAVVHTIKKSKVVRKVRIAGQPSTKERAIEATRGMTDRKAMVAKLVSIGIGATTANTYISNIVRGIW